MKHGCHFYFENIFQRNQETSKQNEWISITRSTCNEREIGQQSVLIEEDDFSLR